MAFLLGFLSACGLNSTNKRLDLKPSEHAFDEDFQTDLWPELEENQILKEQQLTSWPDIKPRSLLILGDESIKFNWGLVLQKVFSKNGSDNLKNTWFLSGCLTARDFKNGGPSLCDFWNKPFENKTDKNVYATLDKTKDAERMAPKIISDQNIEKVVISFGHRIHFMDSRIEIQQELSAIELLAKWAHSAGKKCYVVEPVDGYFLETDKNDFLTDDQKNRLKVSIQSYCEWMDAKILKDNFLKSSNLHLEEILKAPTTAADALVVPPPSMNSSILSTIENDEVSLPENLESPKNVLDPKKQILDPAKSMSELVSSENNPKNSESSLRPRSRPERISRKSQEELRQILESMSSDSDFSAEVISEARDKVGDDQPKYLWNGHLNGRALTEIGWSLLDSNLAEPLVDARELRDVKTFCPKYWDLNLKRRKYFWLYLYSAIARYENRYFNPEALHLEKSSQRHSIGIFQVDTLNCAFGADKNKSKLYDLENNFKCAVEKGADLVRKGKQVADGKYSGKKYIDFGMDGYWSVLRKEYVGPAHNRRTGEYQNVRLGYRNDIIKLTKNIAICE
jgi:hypothetical protein